MLCVVGCGVPLNQSFSKFSVPLSHNKRNERRKKNMSNSTAPDDGALSDAVQEYLLSQSADDVKNITMKILREALEGKFSCELSDRKDLLRECLHNFVASITNKEEENGGEVGQEGDELLWDEDHDGEADFDDLLGIEGNIDDDEEEEEEAVERRSSRKVNAPANASRSGTKGSKGRSGGGFAAPVQCSNELSEFMGAAVVPRTEVTKRIWAYIKEHNLQDPADRRQIVCDEKLEKLFKRKKFGMFKMTKFLSEMMKSTKELQSGKSNGDDDEEDEEDGDDDDAVKTEGSSSSSKKRKTPAKAKASKSKGSSASSSAGSSSAANKKRKSTSDKPSEGGLNKKIKLSDSLSDFLQCTQESRPQVVKKMWDYIKGD